MDDKSALQRLEKKLDARAPSGEADEPLRSRIGGGAHAAAPKLWRTRPRADVPHRRRFSKAEIAFGASLVFFIVAVGISALLFFSGTNTVSTRNVTIVIDGPAQIRAGDVLPLTIAITNRNSVPMQLSDLIVEYPLGTRSEADISVELPRIRESLGTIEPGESVSKIERAVVFGTAGTIASVAVSVEYRVPSSNAIFHSEAVYSVLISESPASITVQSLSEVVSGQAVALEVTVSSNVGDVLPSMLLVAEYPPGFSFTSSTPVPFSGSAVWRIGDIEPAGKRTVIIRGSFSGDDGEGRVVRFTTGAASGPGLSAVAAPLATASSEVTVAKPFVGASLALDGDIAPTHVARRGVPIRADIRWQNNLPTRVQDLNIEVTLAGAILDRASVAPVRGFFRSFDNTVVFSSESDQSFADLVPGATGVVSFTFAALPPGAGVFRNPDIGLSVRVTARRLSDANVPETIHSSAQGSVEIATDLVLSATLSRAPGDLGPVPPKADQETMYTVLWNLSNSENAVANASVSAILPSYVRFVAPSPGALVSYNPVGGIVAWSVGDIPEGSSRSTSFQIAVTPSLSQVGTSPTIVSDQRASAFDRFTLTQIESAAGALTTASGTTLPMGNVVP